MRLNKQLMEKVMSERFKIVEDIICTDIQLDGKTISIEDLVKVANQLAEALSNRGCYFQVMKDE
jgi:hypothetical protein